MAHSPKCKNLCFCKFLLIRKESLEILHSKFMSFVSYLFVKLVYKSRLSNISPMFNKQQKFTGKYLGNQKYLDGDYIRVWRRDMSDYLSLIFYLHGYQSHAWILWNIVKIQKINLKSQKSSFKEFLTSWIVHWRYEFYAKQNRNF